MPYAYMCHILGKRRCEPTPCVPISVYASACPLDIISVESRGVSPHAIRAWGRIVSVSVAPFTLEGIGEVGLELEIHSDT